LGIAVIPSFPLLASRDRRGEDQGTGSGGDLQFQETSSRGRKLAPEAIEFISNGVHCAPSEQQVNSCPRAKDGCWQAAISSGILVKNRSSTGIHQNLFVATKSGTMVVRNTLDTTLASKI